MPEITFACTMQEGHIPQSTREPLAQALADAAKQVAGLDLAGEVRFADIPQGFGFRGGEPSTTSLVRGAVPGGIDQDTRVALMTRICEVWSDISGATIDELVVSVADA